MKHHSQKAPNSIIRVNAPFGSTEHVSPNVFAWSSALSQGPVGLDIGNRVNIFGIELLRVPYQSF